MDFALIAQACTLQSRVPFLHIFDGFRTSHEVMKIEKLSDDDLLRMRNFGKKSLDEMKERLRMRGFIVPETDADELDELGVEDDGLEGGDEEA